MTTLTLLAGLAILLFSGDLFVRGAVSLAMRLAIPTLLIGLTVVAFGTSAPELVISIDAALSGSSGMAVGNVVGSNIANVLLVLGLPAIIYATDCNQPFIRRNMMYVVGASLIFVGFSLTGTLTFWHGLILFGLMVLFLAASAYRARTEPEAANDLTEEVEELAEGALTTPVMTGFLLAGLIGMPLGAHMTVTSASSLAANLGVSEATIGLTIIALGTSLPELATTLMAALRKNCGLALGNVMGSNLFNILAIMGITAMVTPVEVPEGIRQIDLWVMLAATAILVPFVMSRSVITRGPGMALVVGYVAYIAFVYIPKSDASAVQNAGQRVVPTTATTLTPLPTLPVAAGQN